MRIWIFWDIHEEKHRGVHERTRVRDGRQFEDFCFSKDSWAFLFWSTTLLISWFIWKRQLKKNSRLLHFQTLPSLKKKLSKKIMKENYLHISWQNTNWVKDLTESSWSNSYSFPLVKLLSSFLLGDYFHISAKTMVRHQHSVIIQTVIWSLTWLLFSFWLQIGQMCKEILIV